MEFPARGSEGREGGHLILLCARVKRDFPGRSARKSEGLRETVTGDSYFNDEGLIVRLQKLKRIVLIYI